MKLFSLLFAAIVGTAVLSPATADARPYCGERTRVTYDRCGTPVYWSYVMVGRDCHGCPVYRWVVQSRGHRHHGGYARGGYGYRGHGYSSGSVSFHWSR